MGRVLAEGIPTDRPTSLFLTALILLCVALQSRTAATVTRVCDVLSSADITERRSWRKRKQR